MQGFIGCDHRRRFVEHTCIFIVYFGCLVTAGRGWGGVKGFRGPELDRNPGTQQELQIFIVSELPLSCFQGSIWVSFSLNL